MEIQFKKEDLSWLHCPVGDVRNMEQTQEIKLTDGMPDIGRVLAAWGQPVLRSKEWNPDSFGISGGVKVWVLYAPEDGSTVRCLEGWIPFAMQWDLPPRTPEGQIRVLMRTRFVDARSVSPRKVMVRAGMAALGEGYVPGQSSTYIPEEVPEDVQLLTASYPLRMCLEAGEKTFTLDEELILPSSCPEAKKLAYGTLHPVVEDQRVLGNRLVYRGSANLHVLYMSEEGQLFSWDFPVSISQFADLKGNYGNDARGDILLAVTDMDVSLDDEGHFRLKGGIAAQYTVDDLHMLHNVEDAYSVARQLEMERESASLPVILETAERKLTVRQHLPQEANVVADVSFTHDFPRQRKMGDTVEVEQPGTFQVLYYSPEGSLQSSTARWEGKTELKANPEVRLQMISGGFPEPRGQITAEGMELTAQLPIAWRAASQQHMEPVHSLRIGEAREPDPGRPALILCRAGDESLWQMARENGSTMDAIREASGLEGEPEPGQLLLIPVL